MTPEEIVSDETMVLPGKDDDGIIIEHIDDSGPVSPEHLLLGRQVGLPHLTVFSNGVAPGALDDVDLDALARELLEAEGARPEARVLRAEAPASAYPGQRFAIAVSVPYAAEADDATSAALRSMLVKPAGTQVRVDAHATGGLAFRSDATRSLTLYPGRDSDPARFELEATQPGHATVRLRAFAGDSDYLGELALTVAVHAAATGEQHAVQSPAFAMGGQTPNSATLVVDVDPVQNVLSFMLSGPGEIGTQPRVTLPMAQSLDEIASGLQRQLDRIAQGTGWSDKAVEALLRGTGADLWQRLLPPQVKDLLLRNLPDLEALVIVGADDPIPWELLFPVSPGKPQTFLSDRLLISRWALSAYAAPWEVGKGSACYVLPDSAPPAALDEIRQVQAMLGAGRRITTLDALLGALDAADFGLLHFAAHNIVASDLPASAWVKLDQPFQQGMLGADRVNAFMHHAPLVFMNACNSGAGSPLWVGSTGWAGRFLAAGAGAFVGSLWQVRDEPAKAFAASFYQDLKQGKTLGDAFQAARAHVGQSGDPTRLGYTLFGRREARLAEIAETTI